MTLTQTAEVAGDRNPHRDVSRIVQTLMAWRGISQAEVATVLGVDPSGVTRGLHGRRKWQLDDIFAMAALFDVPPSKFLEDPEVLVHSRCSALRGSPLAKVDGGRNDFDLTLEDELAERDALERRSRLALVR